MTASTAGTAIDQVALVPAYVAAGTAVLALLVDLAAPGRRLPVLAVTTFGALGTAWACWWAYPGGGPGSVARAAFCGDGLCSYEWDRRAMVVGIVFALATACVIGLSVPVLRTGEVPAGEYAFLLACSLTGAVVLGASRDLVTLVIALETLTLPLYVLVGLRRRSAESAEAAVTFLIVSVVSTAVTLLGAALLYAATGTVHFTGLRSALASREALVSVPMVGVAVVAVLVGLAFKVAAVPFHAWAPATYDGAPLPVAAYLSTASKLGGVVAILAVAVGALGPWLDVAGPVLALLAVATMTVGNLAALRQQRMVRLLAWSSVAQAGYLLAPLGVFALADGRTEASTATATAAVLAYTIFYILLELVAFGCVIALRGGADGGTLADYREASRQRPWVTAAFVLALTGLAGLPPGLAGLFAKVTVVSSLLHGASGWLALVVALNAVVGLAYYLRASLALFGRSAVGAAGSVGTVGAAGDPPVPVPRSPLPVRVGIPLLVGLVLVVTTTGAVVVGFAPQLVLDAVTLPLTSHGGWPVSVGLLSALSQQAPSGTLRRPGMARRKMEAGVWRYTGRRLLRRRGFVGRNHNGLKTAVLLGLLTSLILLVGYWFGGTGGLVIAVFLSLAMNAATYFWSDKIALRTMGARPVSEAEAPQLYAMVRELSTQAGQPMPRLYISPTPQPNAFATGRNPANAAVCVTEGIMGMLSPRELRGVIGHELSHVYNRDILISSVAAALAGIITMLAQLAWFIPFGRGDDDDGPGFLGILLMMLLGPIAAGLIQMAISRSREFQADASGATLTSDPLALASALRKIHSGTQAMPLPADGQLASTAHLMIDSPFRAAGIANLFSTHPPMEQRVARLEAMASNAGRR